MSVRILVVDDDPEGSLLTSLLLRRAGFDVHVVHTARSALEETDRALPDLVLMDLMIPDMDGLELCRTLRARHGPEELSIVVYTARAAIDSRQAGIEAGAQDVMIKPTPTPEFISRIKAAITRTETSART